MTTTTTLKRLFEIASKTVGKIFLEDGEISPMWHAVAISEDDGKEYQIVIATPWCSIEEKHGAVAALREMFREHNVQRYVFVCEGWMVEVRKLPNEIAPSEHPDRREVITIVAEDRDGSQMSGQFYILRPEHGPAKLSPLQINDDESHQTKVRGGLINGMLATGRGGR